jgi:hypothetical protein
MRRWLCAKEEGMGVIEVTVKVADKEVTLKGPEDFVRSEVQRLTNSVAANRSPVVPPSPVNVSAMEALPATEREFVAAKKPTGHSETVAVLAFFLTKSGHEEFTHADIRRAYARAGIRPPKVIAQALRDAKNLNDYLEAGKKRGSFRLSAHGERTVEFDLPKRPTS